MPDGLTWEVISESPRRIALRGEIDENADFDTLLTLLGTESELDLSGIARINSTGVREWMNFVRAVESASHRLTLSSCSVAIVQQLNMISHFAGEARIASLLAPYICPECEAMTTRLIEVNGEITAQVDAPLPCAECGSATEFDELPDHYFGFWKG